MPQPITHPERRAPFSCSAFRLFLAVEGRKLEFGVAPAAQPLAPCCWWFECHVSSRAAAAHFTFYSTDPRHVFIQARAEADAAGMLIWLTEMTHFQKWLRGVLRDESHFGRGWHVIELLLCFNESKFEFWINKKQELFSLEMRLLFAFPWSKGMCWVFENLPLIKYTNIFKQLLSVWRTQLF